MNLAPNSLSSRQRERLREQSRSVAAEAAALPLARPRLATHLADSAAALARRADAPLLEAAAHLLRARIRTPQSEPGLALVALQRAEAIFKAYGQPVDVALCRIGQAAARADLGHEQCAIDMLVGIAAQASLPLDDRLWAHVLIARCRLHLGDPHTAWQVLNETVAPLAVVGAGAQLRGLLHWIRATTLLAWHLAVVHRPLWIAFPSAPVLPPCPVGAAGVLAELDAAQALLGDSHAWPHLQIVRDFSRALFSRDMTVPQALLQLARSTEADDPAAAAHALFVAGLVQRLACAHEAALQTFAYAQVLADRTQQIALCRDLLQQQAFLHEAAADHARALQLMKRHASMLAVSLAAEVQPHADAPSVKVERQLEPAYLRAALRYIEQLQGRQGTVTVAVIAAHCGVSRRTLELAFRDYRATSVAEFLMQRRLQGAATALADTRLGLDEIALAAGYLSTSAFSRAFKARFGDTPIRWRHFAQR